MGAHRKAKPRPAGVIFLSNLPMTAPAGADCTDLKSFTMRRPSGSRGVIASGVGRSNSGIESKGALKSHQDDAG
ncbi:hypothetical protein D9M72_448230 [compost metagenome]